MSSHLHSGNQSLVDAGFLLVGAILLVGLIWLGENQPDGLSFIGNLLRLGLGLIYVLFVPGYLLQASLFPRGDDLDSVERLGLSFGFSTALIPVLALILDRLPWGLRLWSIVIGQLCLILVLLVVTIWQRLRLPAVIAYTPSLRVSPKTWWQLLATTEKRLYGLLVIMFLFVLGSAAWMFLVPKETDYMTEFYMLGRGGMAEDYPIQAEAGKLQAIILGVTNRERTSMNYRVEVWVENPREDDRRMLVAQEGAFCLEVGQTRTWIQSWTMPWAEDDQRVEFYLFQEGQSSPYRQLVLWLDAVNDNE